MDDMHDEKDELDEDLPVALDPALLEIEDDEAPLGTDPSLLDDEDKDHEDDDEDLDKLGFGVEDEEEPTGF